MREKSSMNSLRSAGGSLQNFKLRLGFPLFFHQILHEDLPYKEIYEQYVENKNDERTVESQVCS